MFRYAPIFGLAAFCIVLFPSITLAQDASSTPNTLPAGFATAPLWISSASSTSGDALNIFTVVNNTSATIINGSVSFLVDGTSVGSSKLSLSAGAANVFSVPWTAVAGTHSVTATLNNTVDANGQSLLLSNTIAGPLSITVSEAPPQPLAVQYLNTAVNVGGSALSGTLAAIDSARQGGANYFATQLGLGTTSAPPASSNAASQSQVLGAATENLANAGVAAATASTPNASLFNRLAYFCFANPIIFYPLLIIIVLLVLWLVSRIFSRKSRF